MCRGVAAFVGRVVTTGASMSDHDDAVLGERPEEFDDAGIGKRELLEERVQLYPADAVVAQRGEVLLDRQVWVDRAEGYEARPVDGADEPVGARHVRGDVGDRQAAREVDPRAVHRGAQPVEGPVAHRREADGPGREHPMGDMVRPDMSMRVDDHVVRSFTSRRARESRMTSVDPS